MDKYSSQQDLHLINKTLTMTTASGNAVSLLFIYMLTECINIIIIKEKKAHRNKHQMPS